MQPEDVLRARGKGCESLGRVAGEFGEQFPPGRKAPRRLNIGAFESRGVAYTRRTDAHNLDAQDVTAERAAHCVPRGCLVNIAPLKSN